MKKINSTPKNVGHYSEKQLGNPMTNLHSLKFFKLIIKIFLIKKIFLKDLTVFSPKLVFKPVKIFHEPYMYVSLISNDTTVTPIKHS